MDIGGNILSEVRKFAELHLSPIVVTLNVIVAGSAVVEVLPKQCRRKVWHQNLAPRKPGSLQTRNLTHLGLIRPVVYVVREAATSNASARVLARHVVEDRVCQPFSCQTRV